MSALAKQLMRLKASAHAMSAIEKDLHLIATTRERLNRGRSVGGRQAANERTQRQGAQASRGAFSNVQAEKTALRECVAMLQRAARGGARGSRRWRLSRCGVTNSLLQGWTEVLKEATTTTTVESSGKMSMNGDSKPFAKGTFSRGLAKRQRVSRSAKQGRRAADATAVSTVRSELGDALHIAAGVMHRQREKLIAREVTACLEGLGAFFGADQAPRPLLGKHALQSSSLLHLSLSLQHLGESAGRAPPAADESEEQNAIGDDLESVVGEWSGAVTAVDSSQHHMPAPVPAEKVAHTHDVSALLRSSGKSTLLAPFAKHVLIVVRGARAAVRGSPSSVRQRRWIVPAAEALAGLAQALLSSSSSALRSALADDAEVAATLAFALQRATLSLADAIIMTPHSSPEGSEGALGSSAAEMECLSKTVQQVAMVLDEVIFPQLVGSGPDGNEHPLGPESVLAVLYAASEWSNLANIANELHPDGRVDPSRWGPELVLAQHAHANSCAGSLPSQQATTALIAICKALAGAKNRPAQSLKLLPTFAALLRSALPAFVPAVEDVPESRLPTLPHQKHGGAHVGKPNPRKRMADAKRREGNMEAAHRTSTTSLVANSLSSLLIANEVLANALAANRHRNSLLDDGVAVACGIVAFSVSLDAQVDAKKGLAARTLLSQSCATAKKVLCDAEMRQRRTRSHGTFEGLVWNPRKVVEKIV